MGLFDTIVGAIQGQAGGASGAQGDLLSSVMGMLNDPNNGGLSGLVEKFTKGGLGEQVASWVGTGHNLPISADQIHSVLGAVGLQDIAAKLGISTTEAAGHLSTVLPQVVDKLTPNGQLPAAGTDLSQLAMTALSGLFGNKSA